MSSPSVETSIWLALKARVQALALSPVLPVAWPNESFTKPSTGYLRVADAARILNQVWEAA